MGKGKGGGKGGYKLPGFNKALKTINQFGNQMHGEADADYAVALSASRAGQAGLGKVTRSLRGDLLRSSRRDSRSLSKLARQARAQKGVVQGKIESNTNKYGTALGQSVAQSFGPAKATAAGTGKVVTSAAKSAKKMTQVGKTVAGIAALGVQAQAKAAKYSLNQALQQRAIIDNQTLANLTGQLYQSALQYNLEWKMWKKQQDYAQKQAKKQGDPQMVALVHNLTGEGATLATGAGEIVREAKGDDGTLPEDFNIATAAAEYAAQQGYAPGGPEEQLLTIILRKMTMGDGMNAPEAYTAAVDQAYGGLPGWDKWGAPLLEASQASVNQQTSAAFLAAQAAAEDQASGNGRTTQLSPKQLREGGYDYQMDTETPLALKQSVSTMRASGQYSDAEIVTYLTQNGWTSQQVKAAM